MFQKKQAYLLVLLAIVGLFSYFGKDWARAADQTDNDVTIKHFDFPLVHVKTIRHKDGTKDVDVKAPFTKIHNPAGPNNAQVKAPFTKVEHHQASNAVKTEDTATQKTVTQKSVTQTSANKNSKNSS